MLSSILALTTEGTGVKSQGHWFPVPSAAGRTVSVVRQWAIGRLLQFDSPSVFEDAGGQTPH
jgi:hypothetical protein